MSTANLQTCPDHKQQTSQSFVFVTVVFMIVTAVARTSSCKNENTRRQVLPEEQASLDSLTSSFIAEATRRGLATADWPSSIEVKFGVLSGKHAGSCKPDAHPKVVTIDHYYWKIASAESREQLVFHELAHCLLKRQHLNDTLTFGECKSWMREKDSDCMINLGNQTWRKFYLDELFEERIAMPDWYDPGSSIDLNQYKAVSITPLSIPFIQLDTLLEAQNVALVLNVLPQTPSDKPEFIGISVNELMFESNTYNIDHTFRSTAGISTGSLTKPILMTNHGYRGFRLTIQKVNDCSYLYLNDALLHTFGQRPNCNTRFRNASWEVCLGNLHLMPMTMAIRYFLCAVM